MKRLLITGSRTLPGIRECLAFQVDNSRGTGHMISIARNHGIEVTTYTHSAEHDDHMAGLLFRDGRFEDAMHYIRRAHIRHPEKADLRNQRGARIRAELKKHEVQQGLFSVEAP